jgi:hypothetical protein
MRIASGAIKQTGTDTFRVWLTRGGLQRQGNPWDPWIIATHPGDNEYRSTERALLVQIPVRHKGPAKKDTYQTIDFPAIPNQRADATELKLPATASSGLPVQFFVVSGPADVSDDGVLRFSPIPPNTRFPVKVIVGAYQWGRRQTEKVTYVPSATPVYQEFLIEKP